MRSLTNAIVNERPLDALSHARVAVHRLSKPQIEQTIGVAHHDDDVATGEVSDYSLVCERGVVASANLKASALASATAHTGDGGLMGRHRARREAHRRDENSEPAIHQ